MKLSLLGLCLLSGFVFPVSLSAQLDIQIHPEAEIKKYYRNGQRVDPQTGERIQEINVFSKYDEDGNLTSMTCFSGGEVVECPKDLKTYKEDFDE